MTGDDLRGQLEGLRESVDTLTASVGSVQAGLNEVQEEQKRSAESHRRLHRETTQLHEEHQVLVTRLGEHEQHLAVHLRDYERQQEQQTIIHAHMAGETAAVREDLKDFRKDFKDHAKAEDLDRKQALAAQKAVNQSLRTTFITVLLSGGGLFLTLLGILLTMWIHSSGAA